MSFTKRRFAALLLAAALAPAAVACDDGPQGTSTENESGTDPAPGSVETERPEEG
jgi:hypothetical protein